MKNNKKVSILNLGRNNVRALLYTDDNENVVVVFDQKEINKILKEEIIEQPILVYNPTAKVQKELKQIILKTIKERDKKDEKGNEIDIEITGEEFLKVILKMLTNIDLGLEEDTEENRIAMQGILDDPSEILKSTHNITLDIFKSLGKELEGTFDALSKMSKDEFKKYSERFKDDELVEIEETEEDKLKREYDVKVEELNQLKAERLKGIEELKKLGVEA